MVHVPRPSTTILIFRMGFRPSGFKQRHIGVELVKAMVDAETTSRCWYFVVTMGRKAGHLALGIGKAAGATLTIIPEEFRQADSAEDPGDILDGSLHQTARRPAVRWCGGLAEGLVEFLDEQDLNGAGRCRAYQHGHVRLAEVNFGVVLKRAVEKELRTFGVKTTIVDKTSGIYELRCTDPISFDMEYTRDLGYCAAQFLLDGGTAAMVSIQNGRFIPIPFGEILDPATGRTRVRMVDIESESYAIARRYMIRFLLKIGVTHGRWCDCDDCRHGRGRFPKAVRNT